jgi:hypothetical protein
MADTSVGTAVIDIKFNLGDLNKQLNQALGGIGGGVGNAGSVAGGAFAGSFLGTSIKSLQDGLIKGAPLLASGISEALKKALSIASYASFPIGFIISKLMGKVTLSKWSEKISVPMAKFFDNIAKSLGSAIGQLTKYAGVITAVAAAVGALVLAWAKDETAILRMPLLFRDATEAASRFYDVLAGRTGVSADDIREVGNEVQSMLVPFLLDRGKAESQMEALTARIFDVSAASGVAASEVGVMFESILQGNMRAAKRLDILMSDTLVDSTALLMSHKSSKDQLTEQEKVLARIKLLMEQTSDREGVFVERSYTVAGSWNIMWSQIKAFGSSLGRIISGIIPLSTIFLASGKILEGLVAILDKIAIVTDMIAKVWLGIWEIIKFVFAGLGEFIARIVSWDWSRPFESLKELWKAWDRIFGKKDLGKDSIEKLKDDLKQGKESAASIADDIKSINTEAQKLAGKSSFNFMAANNPGGGISFANEKGQNSIGKASAKAFEDFLENSKRLLGVNEEQVKLLREVAKGNNSVFA